MSEKEDKIKDFSYLNRKKDDDHIISPGSLIRFKLSKAYRSMEKQEIKAWSKPNVQKVRVKKKKGIDGSVSLNDSMTHHSDNSKGSKSKGLGRKTSSAKEGSTSTATDRVPTPPPGDPNENWEYVRKSLPPPEGYNDLPVFRKPAKSISEGAPPVEKKWQNSNNQWSEMVRTYHSRKLISATAKLSSRAPSATPLYAPSSKQPTPSN